MRNNDAAFKRLGEYNGWKLPPPASMWKRLPIIRNFRMMHYVEEKRDPLTRKLKTKDAWIAYAIGRGFI